MIMGHGDHYWRAIYGFVSRHSASVKLNGHWSNTAMHAKRPSIRNLMIWTLSEINDDVRERLANLRDERDWLTAFAELDLYAKCENTCELLDEEWPRWIEATKEVPVPLRYLLRGEIHPDDSLGGAMDIGFNGAEMVEEIAHALTKKDDSFLPCYRKRPQWAAAIQIVAPVRWSSFRCCERSTAKLRAMVMLS